MKFMTRKDWALFIAMLMFIICSVAIADAHPPKHKKLWKKYYGNCAAYKNLDGVRHHTARKIKRK